MPGRVFNCGLEAQALSLWNPFSPTGFLREHARRPWMPGNARLSGNFASLRAHEKSAGGFEFANPIVKNHIDNFLKIMTGFQPSVGGVSFNSILELEWQWMHVVAYNMFIYNDIKFCMQFNLTLQSHEMVHNRFNVGSLS